MRVNGKEIEFSEKLNLEELLDKLKIDKEKVVVEIDGVIIPKGNFLSTSINESNILEVISFVGGG